MKKIIFFIIISTILTAQEKKSTFLFSKETVTIQNNAGKLDITSFIEEKKHIAKSKEAQNYHIQIPFDNFTEIANIKAKTVNLDTNKEIKLNKTNISTVEMQDNSVFHSDRKIKRFVMPSVTDNSDIYYSYNLTHKDHHLLNGFYFQNELETKTAIFRIICDESVAIGFKLFGILQDKIKHTVRKEGKNNIYEWEATDLPKFKMEAGMPNATYYIPHIIYYIKSYEQNNQKVEVLSDVNTLYKWYYSLVKYINKADQTELTSKAKELTKAAKTEQEKAEIIYHWVQENLNYVAFEYEMGGFIPRDAGEVFTKKYGDCKDMANLLNEMFRAVGLESFLTWIGTRDKNYSYYELPTPLVDNHMITALKINNEYLFFDATDKYCPAFFPTDMIQGKEALIGINATDFVIEKVKTTGFDINKTVANIHTKITNNTINGTATVSAWGYSKSELLNYLGVYNQEAKEIWKTFLTNGNEKMKIEELETNKNVYSTLPAQASFTIQLSNWLKDIGEKKILKPVLLQPLEGNTIDTEFRNYPIKKDYTFTYEINNQITLPEGYIPENIPQNFKIDNELLLFEINYTKNEEIITVSQKIHSKKLLIQPQEFKLWNETISAITKTSNQSILLKKQ